MPDEQKLMSNEQKYKWDAVEKQMDDLGRIRSEIRMTLSGELPVVRKDEVCESEEVQKRVRDKVAFLRGQLFSGTIYLLELQHRFMLAE